MLKEQFINLAKIKSSIGKVFVDAFVFRYGINIGEYADLLDLKCKVVNL